MSLDVLEKIKNESIPLYDEIVRVARNVIDYEKKTSELYIESIISSFFAEVWDNQFGENSSI